MRNRECRVQFRMTLDEYQRYAPLIRTQRHDTWSSLVRVALREYWTRNPPAQSDNVVRQPAGETQSPSLFTRAKKIGKGRAASRREKSRV